MSANDHLAPGAIFGAYVIEESIGSGGMGEVYRARHRTLERDVALKILAARLGSDQAYVDRFLREARAVARLNHPAIVQIYDVGEHDGRYFLVLELVRGRSLGSLLRERGAFPVDQAIAIVRQAALALAVAHEAGIVHRDVKPDNILLSTNGDLKLIDLGLAKRLDLLTDHTTETGTLAGTPHYMAPEQIRGQRDIDGRADVYSLGATLFHLACGRTPCRDGSGGAVLAAHLDGNLLDAQVIAPLLPPALYGVMRRMLARDREQRYPDMRAVERDLGIIAGDDGQGTLVLGAPVHTPTPAGPHRSGADQDTLERLELMLASAIGPVARVLVRQVAREAHDVEDLCRRLAAHVGNPVERERFLARARSLTPGATPPPRPRATGQPLAPPATFAPADLARLEQRLAAAIGPVARVLVRRCAARAVSWEDLVAELAENLPTQVERRHFRDQMRQPR